MAEAARQLIESIKDLSVKERAEMAQMLINSLEDEAETGVDEAWMSEAQARLEQVRSGEVAPVTWDSIKKDLKKPHA